MIKFLFLVTCAFVVISAMPTNNLQEVQGENFDLVKVGSVRQKRDWSNENFGFGGFGGGYGHGFGGYGHGGFGHGGFGHGGFGHGGFGYSGYGGHHGAYGGYGSGSFEHYG